MTKKRKTPTVLITLPDRLREKARRIGGGNASKGIRLALEAWKEMKGEGK
jgi:hypothetical protein